MLNININVSVPAILLCNFHYHKLIVELQKTTIYKTGTRLNNHTKHFTPQVTSTHSRTLRPVERRSRGSHLRPSGLCSPRSTSATALYLTLIGSVLWWELDLRTCLVMKILEESHVSPPVRFVNPLFHWTLLSQPVANNLFLILSDIKFERFQIEGEWCDFVSK